MLSTATSSVNNSVLKQANGISVSGGKNDMVLIESSHFEEYMNLLIFLKDPKDKPIISKLNPKMCLTCWQIFSDREKHEHVQIGSGGPNPIKHKITGTFQSMQ